MVFSFTFFTYNGQRLFRLKKYQDTKNLGAPLKWLIYQRIVLTIFSIIFLFVSIFCVCFISTNYWGFLILIGILSGFYVIPIIPFSSKKYALREESFLKIFIIGLVWS